MPDLYQVRRTCPIQFCIFKNLFSYPDAVYPGSLNPLHYLRLITVYTACDVYLRQFPFDRQFCKIVSIELILMLKLNLKLRWSTPFETYFIHKQKLKDSF